MWSGIPGHDLPPWCLPHQGWLTFNHTLEGLKMSHYATAKTAESQWRASFSAVRAGRASLDMPFAHEAFCVVAQTRKSATAARHERWLSKSIPSLTASSRSGLSLIDVARWLVPARAALYALWAMRRISSVVGGAV
jgi:hypothetical protein